jgi:hypothetical protein
VQGVEETNSRRPVCVLTNSKPFSPGMKSNKSPPSLETSIGVETAVTNASGGLTAGAADSVKLEASNPSAAKRKMIARQYPGSS